ncbi:MAG: class I SAM-dependent methyltransferase [Thermoplasmata archaeon]
MRPVPPASARERFRQGNRYRAEREWKRYEGTAQRDLFRELRDRFLSRHAPPAARAIDLGSGPGRFTGLLGSPSATRRIALDIGRGMLQELPVRWRATARASPLPDRVRADASCPPFENGSFGIVAALGNIAGFEGAESDRFLDSLVSLVAPGGMLLLEVAPGPGERSRYLHRLPAGSVARLLRSPPGVVVLRTTHEGFTEEPPRRSSPGEFRRIDPVELRVRLERAGFRVVETVAVAPALGADAARAAAVRPDAKAWDHLLAVEETIGSSPDRWPRAAAVLLAARHAGDAGPAPTAGNSEKIP